MSKLLHSEQQLLRDWAVLLNDMFSDKSWGPYQVGSTLNDKDRPHRDIDLRTMLEPKDFKSIQKIMNVDRLNLAISLWGQKVTGLPIDFQVQDREYANEHYSSKNGKHLRSAVWISGIAKGDGYEPKSNVGEESK